MEIDTSITYTVCTFCGWSRAVVQVDGRICRHRVLLKDLSFPAVGPGPWCQGSRTKPKELTWVEE